MKIKADSDEREKKESSESGEAPQVAKSKPKATGTVIKLPLEGFSENALENLRLLIASKALLIKTALEVTDLSVVKGKNAVKFPWFERKLSRDEVTAYTHFLTLLADMAKRQSRVLAVERPVENQKYAFRCFLLRLGMIGEEYALTRRILLRNLTGNGSLKRGEVKPRKHQADAGETSAEALVEETQKGKEKSPLKRLMGNLKLMLLS